MKNAIIVHGKPDKESYYNPDLPSSSNYHWIPWLQKQLIVKEIKADTPEMPYAYKPEYETWVKEVERFDISPETVLIGHSASGGFWVRYLSERKGLAVGKVILVAPSLGLSWDDRSFFDFEIDPGIASRTAGMTIIYSDNDKQATLDAVKIFKEKINDLKTIKLHLGHFTADEMSGPEFPELLEEILK